MRKILDAISRFLTTSAAFGNNVKYIWNLQFDLGLGIGMVLFYKSTLLLLSGITSLTSN